MKNEVMIDSSEFGIVRGTTPTPTPTPNPRFLYVTVRSLSLLFRLSIY